MFPGSIGEISYPQVVDLPPQPDRQAPAVPSVPVQRPGDGLPVPASAPTAPRRRPRNWRLIIAVTAAALASLCAAGSLSTYIWYGKATKPNRGSPTVVVLQYLNAYLGSGDTGRAALFACGSNPDLPAVRAARDDLKSREQQYNVSIDVMVDGVRETSRSDDHAEVAASLALTTVINGSSQRVVEHWIFQTEDRDGWRVCDGHEVN